MQFYRATSILFPRSLRERLFALCCITTTLPLLCYMGWGFATGRFAWAEFLILTLATVAGLVGALTGIAALLDPIQTRRDGERAKAPALSEIRDIITKLYVRARHAAVSGRARIDGRDIDAHEDALTGIANRRGFLAQLDALPPAKRRGCLAIIDIDHFSQLSGLLGFEEGDRILRDFATRLSSQTRRIDVIGRWGGEEFAVFYQDCIEDEASWSLARIAERMRDDPIGVVEGSTISFSAGLCSWRGGPVEAAISRADEALHQARRLGRNQVQRATGSTPRPTI